jgi:hypothetical protein
MAIKLQFLTIIARREALRRPDLPPYLTLLNPLGGILIDTIWYDEHLWCETVMNDFDAVEAITELHDYGLTVPPRGEAFSDDVCVAASQQEPPPQCAWLAYDPADNCVWLAGTAKGTVIGGREQGEEQERLLAELQATAERHYTAMYDSRHLKDSYEDACMALHRAQIVAQFLHRRNLENELAAREAHIRAVYNAQFRR